MIVKKDGYQSMRQVRFIIIRFQLLQIRITEALGDCKLKQSCKNIWAGEKFYWAEQAELLKNIAELSWAGLGARLKKLSGADSSFETAEL